MTANLERAISEDALSKECGTAFRSEYGNLSDEGKKKMLDTYADHVLNIVIYRTACKVMTDNNFWVADVVTTYTQYCNNIVSQDNSGVNAFLNYIYLTHAFEGEVRKDIETFCDGMIAQVRTYLRRTRQFAANGNERKNTRMFCKHYINS